MMWESLLIPYIKKDGSIGRTLYVNGDPLGRVEHTLYTSEAVLFILDNRQQVRIAKLSDEVGELNFVYMGHRQDGVRMSLDVARISSTGKRLGVYKIVIQ